MKLLKDLKINIYLIVFTTFFLGCFNSNKNKDMEYLTIRELEFVYKKIMFKGEIATITFNVYNKSKNNYYILKSYKSDFDNFIYPKISYSDKSVIVDFKPQVSKKNEDYNKMQENKEPPEVTIDSYEIEILKSGENIGKVISFNCNKDIRNFSLKLYAGICNNKELDLSKEHKFFISPNSQLLNQFVFQEWFLDFKL